MKGTIQYLGRGLLVLALCGWAVGCGDDDDSGGSDSGVDGGGTGGGGGTTGGSGGSNQKDGGGTDGGGGSGGGGSVTMAQCVDMTNTNTGNMAQAACVSCVCSKDIDATVACKADCWSLISCVGSKCGGSATSGGCLTDSAKCGDEFSAATTSDSVTPATNLGMVITMMCSSECVASAPSDGGAEDGGN